MTNQPIATSNAPAAIGTYSQAVKTNSSQTVYISGQIPLDPTSMEMVSDDFADQAHQVFKNLTAVAEAAGGTLKDCVKLTVYLTNLDDFVELNTVMAQYIAQP